MNLFDHITTEISKPDRLSWENLSRLINTQYTDVQFASGEALRSWYRREKQKHSPAQNMPVSIPTPFDPIVHLDLKPTLVFADLHCPYHHEQFIKTAIEYVETYSVEQIIIAGDLLDLDSLSRYSKSHNIARLETELEITGQMLLYLAQFAPVYITHGNHDARFFDKLDAPLSFQRLISAALNGRQTKHTIHTTERDYLFVGEQFIVGHLDKGSSIAGKLAYAIAQKYNRHALVGHDHLTDVFTGAPKAKYLGASIGCAADHEKFWYAERRMNAMPFMTRGYAVVHGTEDDFSLFNADHELYFGRQSGYNCFKV